MTSQHLLLGLGEVWVRFIQILTASFYFFTRFNANFFVFGVVQRFRMNGSALSLSYTGHAQDK